jgi:hypothetical protein
MLDAAGEASRLLRNSFASLPSLGRLWYAR